MPKCQRAMNLPQEIIVQPKNAIKNGRRKKRGGDNSGQCVTAMASALILGAVAFGAFTHLGAHEWVAIVMILGIVGFAVFFLIGLFFCFSCCF
ncbi:hypothetical protein niasHS_000330 [Heterodera schachtii]|uniref:Uncharacterized protein n=1 Tax=Heterodera schachtii TaxID=97005 RepID=A0ABD2KLH0_HETSC